MKRFRCNVFLFLSCLVFIYGIKVSFFPRFSETLDDRIPLGYRRENHKGFECAARRYYPAVSTQNTARIPCLNINFPDIPIGREKCLPIRAAASLYSSYNQDKIKQQVLDNLDHDRDLMTFRHQPDFTSFVSHPKDRTKWRLVFFVKTSIINMERRNSIRSTWGAIKIYKSVLIELVFIVGTSKDSNVQRSLEEEVQAHNDILQMELQDGSDTVPYKVLAGMQWSRDNVPLDWVYASLDDDVMVYVPNLVDYVDSLLQPSIAINSSNAGVKPCYESLPVVCIYNTKRRDIPCRDETKKWFVSKEQYPAELWPTHCRGGFYLMSNKLAADIFKESRRTPFILMDDVWITGIMRRKLGYGDCNIMAAPYSEFTDSWFSNLFYNFGGKDAFVKHLWGNIKGFKVDIPHQLRLEWDAWTKRKI